MKIIRTALACLIVGAVLATFAAVKVYPAVTGLTAVRIEGPSMGATVPYGSLVYVQPADRYAVGDVITFARNFTLVTHRIIADVSGNGDLFATQGDAVARPDPGFVRPEHVLGRALAYVPAAGIVSKVLTAPTVIGFLFLIVVALVYWPERPNGKMEHVSQDLQIQPRR